MLFYRANLATSLIFLMESSSSKLRSAMPLRGVDAMVSQRWCCGLYESGVIGAGPSLAGRPAVLRLWTALVLQI